MVVAALLALYYVIPVDGDGGWAVLLAFAVSSALFVWVVIRQLRAIVRAEHPQLRAFEGLAMATAVWVLVYALLYLQAAKADATAFSEPMSRTAALYFTVTVLSTVGFGDITPVTDGARALVTVQMVGNVFIIATAVKITTHVAQRTLDRRAQERRSAEGGPASDAEGGSAAPTGPTP